MHESARSPRVRARLLFATLLMAATAPLAASSAAHAQADIYAEPERADDADALARVEFEAGRTAYDARHYAEALAAFERAYALSARPQLLYNIAQAADRLRRDDRALEAFEQFLAEVPATPLRASVEERIAVLRAAIAAREPRSGDGAARPEHERERNVLGPVLLLGAGGLLAIGGTISLAVGLGDRDTVEGAADGTTLADVQSAADRAPLLMNAGLVLLGVGLAAAAVGLVWLLVPPSSNEDPSVAVAPAAGGVLVTGAF